MDGCPGEAHHGRVVERRAHDVHVVVVRLDVKQEQQAGQAQRGFLGRDPAQGPEDAFGVAGGAGGVVHDVTDGAIGWVLSGLGIA